MLSHHLFLSPPSLLLSSKIQLKIFLIFSLRFLRIICPTHSSSNVLLSFVSPLFICFLLSPSGDLFLLFYFLMFLVFLLLCFHQICDIGAYQFFVHFSLCSFTNIFIFQYCSAYPKCLVFYCWSQFFLSLLFNSFSV